MRLDIILGERPGELEVPQSLFVAVDGVLAFVFEEIGLEWFGAGHRHEGGGESALTFKSHGAFAEFPVLGIGHLFEDILGQGVAWR